MEVVRRFRPPAELIGLLLVLAFGAPALAAGQTAQWTYLGLGGHEVRAVKIVEPYLFAATGTGVQRWTLGSPDTLWTPLGPDSLDAGALLFLDASTLLAGGLDPSGQKLYRSMDQGLTWTVVSMPRPHWFVEELRRHPLSPDTLYASDGGALLRSGDAGQNWVTVTSILQQWRTVVMSPMTPGRVWAGGESPFFSPTLFSSVDGGETWVLAPTPHPSSENSVISLAIDPAEPNRLYAGMEGYIERSVDSGTTWTLELASISPYSYFRDLEIDPGNSTRVFAAESPSPRSETIRLFRSLDHGDTWSALSHATGTPEQYGLDLDLHQVENGIEVYLGGSGVYRVTFPEATGIGDPDAAIATRLYPPILATGSMEIRYTIGDRDVFLDLAIYDIQGRRVKALVVEDPGAGDHHATWGYDAEFGQRPPAGVYFLRLRTRTGQHVQKLIGLFR